MKLYYFNEYIRAEPIRLLLDYVGAEYEDVRLTHEEWPDMKYSGKFEYHCIPMLEKDGKSYSMSRAILKYLGMTYDLYPTDPEEIYEIEKLLDLLGDYTAGIHKLYRVKDPKEKKKMFAEYLEDYYPRYLGYFDKHLQNNSSQEFMVGDKITCVDFFMLHHLERAYCGPFFKNTVGPILDSLPTLKAYFDARFEAQKEYYDNRPECSVFK